MKCYTADGGVTRDGIRLKKDPPASPEGNPRYFVHVQPDHFGEVKSVAELLRTGCAHFDGDDVVVDRCLFVDGDLQPETMADGKALVLGGIDHRQAVFTGDVVAPAAYRTILGVNICFHAVVQRHLNRHMGRTTGHERHVFLGIFGEGDRLKSNILFEDEAGARLDIGVRDGELISFRGGVLACHDVAVVRH
jgi:hypothetical protein